MPVYRRLLHGEPTIEERVRALYRCYAVLGDRTALVMEDRRLRRALREELADPDDPDDDPAMYQPHPETLALFASTMENLGRGLAVVIPDSSHVSAAA